MPADLNHVFLYADGLKHDKVQHFQEFFFIRR